MSVARRTDHEVLRQVTLLLHREPAARPRPVSGVHYADQSERSFDQVKAIRFPTPESAAAFVQDALKADQAGLGDVIEKMKAQDTRVSVRDGERPTGADLEAVQRLAALLHAGELAVAPAQDNDRVFYFFRWRQAAVVPSERAGTRGADAAPSCGSAASRVIAEFPPLPAPSGVALASCDRTRHAAAPGVPFAAA